MDAKRGGRRVGSGRKPTGSSCGAVVSVYLTPEEKVALSSVDPSPTEAVRKLLASRGVEKV